MIPMSAASSLGSFICISEANTTVLPLTRMPRVSFQGQVEGYRRHRQHPFDMLFHGLIQDIGGCTVEIADACMAQHHALRPARRAGSINHTSQVISCHEDIGVFRVSIPDQSRSPGLPAGCSDICAGVVMRKGRAGIVDNVPDALCGILRVAGDKCGPCLQYAKQRGEIKLRRSSSSTTQSPCFRPHSIR